MFFIRSPKWMLIMALLAMLFFSCQAESERENLQEPQETSSGTVLAEDSENTEDMVKIPAGDFLYGATEAQVQFYLSGAMVNFPGMIDRVHTSMVTPQETVTLDSFLIDQFEVTNEQYGDFVSSSGYLPEDSTDYLKHWTEGDSYPEWAATFPVIWVSQIDAAAYCRWRVKRLPTEQEWEKAARGTDGRYYPFGNIAPSGRIANYSAESLEPAGNRPGDVSPFEVYDVAGNAAEWTSGRMTFNNVVLGVVRGGSFKMGNREMLTYQRNFGLKIGLKPGDRAEHVGFRCVKDNVN